MTPEEAAVVIIKEYRRAKEQYPPPFHSRHEAYAVILEEMDELWDAIKTNNWTEAQWEAVQVAAMTLQFVIDFGSFPAAIVDAQYGAASDDKHAS